jgi:hypothetical protein
MTPEQVLMITKREQVSTKVLEIAKGILKSQQFDPVTSATECHVAEKALKWLKKALTLVDGAEDEISATGRALKV